MAIQSTTQWSYTIGFESIKRLEKNLTDEIVDASINSTLFRTMLTLGTTLLAALPSVLICTGLVKDFSLIISFGIAVGTCSAIFIYAPILTCRALISRA